MVELVVSMHFVSRKPLASTSQGSVMDVRLYTPSQSFWKLKKIMVSYLVIFGICKMGGSHYIATVASKVRDKVGMRPYLEALNQQVKTGSVSSKRKFPDPTVRIPRFGAARSEIPMPNRATYPGASSMRGVTSDGSTTSKAGKTKAAFPTPFFRCFLYRIIRKVCPASQ